MLVPRFSARSTLNEYTMYCKERTEQEAKIKIMKADGTHKYDVRKLEEVLVRTAKMIKGTHSRLESAVVDMQKLLDSEDCGYLGDCEEVIAARAIIKEAQAALATQNK